MKVRVAIVERRTTLAIAPPANERHWESLNMVRCNDDKKTEADSSASVRVIPYPDDDRLHLLDK